jgi:hypothetical protein
LRSTCVSPPLLAHFVPHRYVKRPQKESCACDDF